MLFPLPLNESGTLDLLCYSFIIHAFRPIMRSHAYAQLTRVTRLIYDHFLSKWWALFLYIHSSLNRWHYQPHTILFFFGRFFSVIITQTNLNALERYVSHLPLILLESEERICKLSLPLTLLRFSGTIGSWKWFALYH